jgi:hypothetical protein
MPSAQHLRLLSAREAVSRSVPRVGHVVIDNPRLLRAVTRVLKAVGIACTTPEDAGVSDIWEDESSIDLIVFDLDSATPDNRRSLIRLAEMDSAPALILLSEQGNAPMLRDLASYPSGYNLVLKNGHIDNGDLLVTARKLVGRDIFGVDKYLRWGSVVHTCQLHSSAEKNDAIAQLESFLEDLQCDHRYITNLANVADEFISNAFFHAPTDGGIHPYSNESRKRVITLPDSTPAPSFEYGSDGKSIAVACRDPFGSLQVGALLQRLAKCVEARLAEANRGPGGAGLGIYMSYRSLDHMVINLEPDVATEFLGLVDVSNPYRDHLRLPRSLNVFTLNPFGD